MSDQARVVQLRPGLCQARTSSGRPCRNRAVAGLKYCRTHAEHEAGTGERARSADARLDWLPQGELERLFEVLRRRLSGDYEVDVFGFDREFTEAIAPLFEPLLKWWLRVETLHTERIPADGPALLVSNHAGTLPLDGVVLRAAAFKHPPHRHARMLVADLAFSVPWISHFVRKTGNVLACVDDATRLLQMGELVCVFPEGFKGVGKGWRNRYKLQRFGRGGFVEIAIRTRSPIVPVAIVGSEESYPMIANIRPLARLLGLPYFPVTPTFPLLGPLGAIPLPSKWIIEYGEPIRTDNLEPDAAGDPMVVMDITDHVRQSIQESLLRNLRLRRTMFS